MARKKMLFEKNAKKYFKINLYRFANRKTNSNTHQGQNS